MGEATKQMLELVLIKQENSDQLRQEYEINKLGADLRRIYSVLNHVRINPHSALDVENHISEPLKDLNNVVKLFVEYGVKK